jgi:hypothetical protein
MNNGSCSQHVLPPGLILQGSQLGESLLNKQQSLEPGLVKQGSQDGKC